MLPTNATRNNLASQGKISYNNNMNGLSCNNNNNNNFNNTQASSALDALPKQFVLSMKKLFDILDDRHSGYVKFSDIEKGWQDDGSKGLPRGVIESLRKVTPPSGLLSFERFCAGLKLCLLRNQKPDTSPISGVTATPTKTTQKPQMRPPSAPLLEIENPLPCAPTIAVRPSAQRTTTKAATTTTTMSSAHRALSMPQLSPDSEIDANFTTNSVYGTPPPPKPPRASASGLLLPPNQSSTVGSAGLDKAEIRNALQNWQMNLLLGELDDKNKVNLQFDYRGSADGGSSSTTDSAASGVAAAKKSTTKRREPRRHTLQNGIDYNMLKRLKQYEEERELLLLGLDGVEKARDWYMQQVLNVQEKIKYFGRLGTNFEQYSEVQQERLNYQRVRIFEVNYNLSNLIKSWERGGYPQHINLAIRTANKTHPTGSPTQHLQYHKRYLGGISPLESEHALLNERLRHQNRQLASELNAKSERIALLEREMQRFAEPHNPRAAVASFVLSQPSPVSQSSGGLGDADVVY